MQRPDLDTLACVNPACQLFGRTDEGHLTVRKVSGHDQLRLLRCRPCGEAFSARRGSALCTTQRPEATAEEVIHPLGDGCRGRATARLVTVCTETVARLLRVTGRHAERLHDPHGRDLRPMALACDAQWRGVKKSKNAVPIMHGVQRATGGRRPPWPLTARGWWP